MQKALFALALAGLVTTQISGPPQCASGCFSNDSYFGCASYDHACQCNELTANNITRILCLCRTSCTEDELVQVDNWINGVLCQAVPAFEPVSFHANECNGRAISTTSTTSLLSAASSSFSTQSATPTHSYTPPTPPTPSGLSAGAAAGIGVGATLGGIGVLGLAAFYILKRRKKAKSGATTVDKKEALDPPPAPPAPHDTAEEKPAHLHGNPIHEVWNQPAEMEGTNGTRPIHELG